MSDDDRFAAFDQVEGNADGSKDDDSEPEPEPSADDGSSDSADLQPDPTPVTETETESTTDGSEQSDESIDDPAFSYAASNQGPIYARPETWEKYDDALELDVERYLRDRGVRNAQKRELHDAALRLAVDHPEELAELLIEARRES